MTVKSIRLGKRLNWLIALMTTSLLGVTGVQAYWLQNAYNLKQEKFDRDVIAAATEVSERLENLESMRFISESFQIEPFFTEKLSPNFRVNSGDSARRTSSGGSLKLTMRLGGDTVLEFNNSDKKAVLTAYRSEDSSTQDLILESKPEDMLKKGMHLDMVLRKLIVHEMRRKNMGNLINQKTLDSLISFELKRNGIDMPYEFAILKDNAVNLSSKDWNLQQIQHQTALFPTDFFASQTLSLSFPNKNNYLLRSMWVMLLVSLFFTTAIIVAFYRTLSFSLRQKRISEIKTDFINNMTHEFKTPIATINLAIDALRNKKVINNPEKIAHYSNMIRQENNRMNMQVESVLRMALMDKQELDLNFTMVDLHQLVLEAIEHVSLQLENRGGKLTKFLDGTGVTLKADANHLGNTIINLLDNAIKYSPTNPQLKVVTELTRNYFILVVSDKGLGMTKEEQKHIFERFYRVSSGNLHNIKGHGLGLSYAKGIIEAHGGRMEVESEKGKGSKFYIYLPLNTPN
jgi:signal transduction histidine kinase